MLKISCNEQSCLQTVRALPGGNGSGIVWPWNQFSLNVYTTRGCGELTVIQSFLLMLVLHFNILHPLNTLECENNSGTLTTLTYLSMQA